MSALERVKESAHRGKANPDDLRALVRVVEELAELHRYEALPLEQQENTEWCNRMEWVDDALRSATTDGAP